MTTSSSNTHEDKIGEWRDHIYVYKENPGGESILGLSHKLSRSLKIKATR
jgi:hypothetical protein